MTYYIIAYVPAASLVTAEDAVAPYLASPTGTGTPTAYGCCAPANDAIPQAAKLLAALPTLIAAFPGSAYQIVAVKDYNYQTSWLDWLQSNDLMPITSVSVGP